MSETPPSTNIFCTSCGTRNLPGAKFCGFCGQPIQALPQQPGPFNQVPKPQTPVKVEKTVPRKFWLFSVLGLVVIGAVILLLVLLNQTPSKNLVGKWNYISNSQGDATLMFDIEFFSDGTCYIPSPFLAANSFQYSVFDTNRIRIESGSFGSILRYYVTSDTLRLIFENGGSNEYKRGNSIRDNRGIVAEPGGASTQAPPPPAPTLFPATPAPTRVPTTTVSTQAPSTSATLPACTTIGQRWVSPVDGMVLLCVPAGEFLMGASDADKDALPQEKPQHRVTLNAYWIDQTEVTNAQYQKCVQAGKCRAPDKSSSITQNFYYGNNQFASYPVFYVSWEDAQSYCSWAGRRLPTEAEWEKAARGTDGRIYPWGNQVPDGSRLNFNQQKGDTTAVGSYPLGASPYGALDMAGNLNEYVADWYDSYRSGAANNPSGPLTGQGRVVRGGSWITAAKDVRISLRAGVVPNIRMGADIGFRCAR